jgi:hypothetical protein
MIWIVAGIVIGLLVIGVVVDLKARRRRRPHSVDPSAIKATRQRAKDKRDSHGGPGGADLMGG